MPDVTTLTDAEKAAVLTGIGFDPALATRGIGPVIRLSLKADGGALMDGVSDDTAAFAVCLTKLAGKQGIIIVPPGILTCNLVMGPAWVGVKIQGPGWGFSTNEGSPTGTFAQPFDTTKPVFQIGDDTGTVEGVEVSDFQAKNGQVHFRFGGGAIRCRFPRVKSYAASVAGLDYYGGVNYPSVHCLFSDSYARVFASGAIAMRLSDRVNSDTIFNNDHFASNVSIKGGPAGLTLYNYDSILHATNLKMDGRPGSVVIEKSVGGHVPPNLDMASSEADSAASSDVLVVLKGYADTATTRLDSPISLGIHIDGYTLLALTTTTGSVSNGGTTLTVADATGAAVGRYVLVRAATSYSAKVVSVSGTTLTLDTAAPVAATNVEVVIGRGWQGLKGFAKRDTTVAGSSLQVSNLDHPGPMADGMLPAIVGFTGAANTSPPYTRAGYTLELGWNSANSVSRPFFVVSTVRSQVVPDSVIRTGTSIAVNMTTAGTGGAAALDNLSIVRIEGANEAGINGDYAITATSGSIYTVGPSTVSASTTATGSLRVSVYRCVKFDSGGITFPRGITFNFTDPNGNAYTPLSVDGNGNVVFRSSSLTSSTLTFNFGSGQAGTNTNVFSLATSGGVNALRCTGAGGLSLGTGSGNPSVLPSLALTDAAADYGGTGLSGNDALILNNAGVPRWKVGTGATSTLGTKVAVPASATDTGTPGQWAADNSFFYVCTGTNAWRRVAVVSW